ncbi:zinc ribbon domain-containing protein [Amycolatopsis roodepoortensis]|uniref:NADase-type glycan-binding domain-containing protein n=1 Tax=Amycolatopsis roodepoortensis TaxID=700274 RepID=UPI00214B355F|nr:zinc ribbon domain-containing protein [Amycolatopsis roodepoortensis]UUV33056.1 zinc ribbon domain-containing protein [Amycolatopsis roodepoortensis]
MVIYRECGHQGPADVEFCGECGRYLKWDDEEPVAARQPAAQQHVVQPGEQLAPVRQPQQRTAEEQVLNPGDLICGRCGKGNVPTRNFCGRCGASLAESEVVKTSWWRRLFGRRAKEHKAGERPGKDGVRRRAGRAGAARRRVGKAVRRVIAVMLLLSALIYALYQPFRGAINTAAVGLWNQTTGIFETKLNPVRPSKVTATAQSPGHPGNLAGDNATNTFWAAPAQSEPVLVFTFDRPVDLRKAIVHSGNGANFQAAHRPKTLHLVFSTGKTYDMVLADTPDAQEVPIENSAGATGVELHVVGLHRSLDGMDVAISEIELFEAG